LHPLALAGRHPRQLPAIGAGEGPFDRALIAGCKGVGDPDRHVAKAGEKRRFIGANGVPTGESLAEANFF
jgi:hypothetical protein